MRGRGPVHVLRSKRHPRLLEATGGAHFRGHYFVFDERERLDARLAPAHLDQDSGSGGE